MPTPLPHDPSTERPRRTGRTGPQPVSVWLDELRRLGLLTRGQPRCDIDCLCSRLHAEPGQPVETCALAFLRAISAAIGRPVVMHRPGARQTSFDEAWILRILSALKAEDWDSLAFNLGARLPRGSRSRIRFLAGSLAAHVDFGDRTPT